MNVWIVRDVWDYEFDNVVAVVDSNSGAGRWIQEHPNPNHGAARRYEVSVFVVQSPQESGGVQGSRTAGQAGHS